MTPAEAVATIQACIDSGDYTIRRHVYRRLSDRQITQPELMDLLSDPAAARTDGRDQHGRERWFLSGLLAGGGRAEALVALDRGPHTTVFTIYWLS